MANNKNFLKSKTVWLNVVAVLVLLAQTYLLPGFALDPQLQAGVLAALNFALRFKTDGSISLK